LPPDAISDPVPKNAEEYLIQISTAVKLGFKSVNEKLDDIGERVSKVEETANAVRDYPEFRKMMVVRCEKYDRVCHQTEAIPFEISDLKKSVAAIGSRVDTLEDDGIRKEANGSLMATMWEVVNKPIVMALIIIAFQIYLHVTGGKI